MNTGDVIASLASADQNLVTGQPVNTAAQLRQAANPGEILVGGLTLLRQCDSVPTQG